MSVGVGDGLELKEFAAEGARIDLKGTQRRRTVGEGLWEKFIMRLRNWVVLQGLTGGGLECGGRALPAAVGLLGVGKLPIAELAYRY